MSSTIAMSSETASLSDTEILGLIERLRTRSSPVSAAERAAFLPLKLRDVTPGKGKTFLDGDDADAVQGRWRCTATKVGTSDSTNFRLLPSGSEDAVVGRSARLRNTLVMSLFMRAVFLSQQTGCIQ